MTVEEALRYGSYVGANDMLERILKHEDDNKPITKRTISALLGMNDAFKPPGFAEHEADIRAVVPQADYLNGMKRAHDK